MRKILLLVAVFASATALAQKTIYTDSLNNTVEKGKHQFYRVVENYDDHRNEYAFTEYYLSGSPKLKGHSTSKDYLVLTGNYTGFFENGNKKEEGKILNGRNVGAYYQWYPNQGKRLEAVFLDTDSGFPEQLVVQYWDEDGNQLVRDSNGTYSYKINSLAFTGNITGGRKHGQWIGATADGNEKFIETYDNGKFILGKHADANGNITDYLSLEQKPEFPGGLTAFYEYIGKNFRIPNNEHASGRIFTKFVIEKDGTVTDVQIVRGLSEKLDKEAIRLLKKSPKWIPGLQRGQPVRVMYTLPIKISQ